MMKSFRIPLMGTCVFILLSGCTKDEDPEIPDVFTPTPGCFDPVSYTEQVPNLDFELWGYSNESNGKYEEPCGGVWATGNPGTALFNEYIVTKTSDVQNGSFAARLETKTAFNVLSAGSMFTGDFTANFNNPSESAQLGVPFNKKPSGFEGYYKYTSVNGDSSQVYALLTKYNASSKRRDTVGYGQYTEHNSVSSYTKFNFSLDYNFPMGSASPDSLVLVFVSSKAGLQFKGEVGSTLFVDNCAFVY